MENLMLYIIIGFGVLVLILFVLYFQTRSTLKKLMSGKSGQDLESIILENNQRIADFSLEQDSHTKQIIKLQSDFKKSIQKIEMIRFNPFKETGGSQSFAMALLDQNNNGVIISSLYSRERLNVFAKAIENGTSTHQLSNEEQQVINQAINNK